MIVRGSSIDAIGMTGVGGCGRSGDIGLYLGCSDHAPTIGRAWTDHPRQRKWVIIGHDDATGHARDASGSAERGLSWFRPPFPRGSVAPPRPVSSTVDAARASPVYGERHVGTLRAFEAMALEQSLTSEDVVGRSIGDDEAAIHHHRSRQHLGNEPHVVGGDDHRL